MILPASAQPVINAGEHWQDSLPALVVVTVNVACSGR